MSPRGFAFSLVVAFGSHVAAEDAPALKYQRFKYPCSAKVPELKQSRLYREICHRQRMVTGLAGDPRGGCYIDVRLDKSAEIEDTVSMIDGFPCKLRHRTKGQVTEEAYKMFNNQLSLDKRDDERQPFAIAFPSTPEQIQDLLQLAKRLQWPVFVVGAGHGAEAWGNGNGLIVSFMNRRSLDIISDASELGWNGPAIKLGCGVVWAEAYAMAESAKSFMCGGSCGTVGTCGFLMGGGFGYLSGQLGFAADNVLRMDVVTAAGDLLQVTPTRHADLFDVLRGGGQVGLAVVHDVYYKLHPRSRFGCIFKINLVYSKSPEEGSGDPAWAMRLAELDPRTLNVKLRWQCDEQHGHPFKFKVTLILLADPEISTRDAAAGHLKDLLEKVKAPFPEGEFCSGGDWMKCLLGIREKPTSWYNCDAGDPSEGLNFSGPDGELVNPSTDSDSENEWGLETSWHNLASNKKRPSEASLYSDGYKHRTTLKSLLVKELRAEMFGAARGAICDRNAGSTYIAAVWWGNGQWAIPGRGSVADVHKPFKYLFIVSADFHHSPKDNHALAWSSRVLKMLHSASAEGSLFYPNLYDRMFVYNSSVPPFGENLTYEYNPWLTYGEKTGMVLEAKQKWDPDSLFPSRFQDYLMTNQPANAYLAAWSASKTMPVHVPHSIGMLVLQHGLSGIVGCASALLGYALCKRRGHSDRAAVSEMAAPEQSDQLLGS